MGLGIYTVASNPASLLSQDSTFTAPFFVALDGRAGGVFEQKLYVRNDGSPAAKYYITITVVPVDTGGASIVDGTDGYSWKLKAGDPQPSEAQWAATTAGASISIADIGSVGVEDTSSYRPFWVRVEIPENAPARTYTDVQLKIDADQLSI